MSVENGFSRLGRIQTAILDGFLVQPPKELIRQEHGFSSDQLSAALQRLVRRGVFDEIRNDPQFLDWYWGNYNKVGRVRNQLLQGASREEIISHTGLTRSEVSHALGYLRSLGEYPEATPESSGRAMSEAQRAARGSIWPIIKPYAQIRMSPSEIVIARRIETGEELDPVKVGSTLKFAFQSPYIELPKRTPEENRDSRIRALFETAELREQRVKLWLDAAAFLILDRQSTYWPGTRTEWMDIITELKQERLINPEALQWRSLLGFLTEHDMKLDALSNINCDQQLIDHHLRSGLA